MPTKEDILDAIAGMTVLELKELKEAFEERFGVTAAAPHGGHADDAGGGEAAPVVEEQDEFDVMLARGRRKEDQRDQRGALAHQPRPQRGQGSRRRRPQARAREGFEGRRRKGQGPARKRRRLRRLSSRPVRGVRFARPASPPNGAAREVEPTEVGERAPPASTCAPKA